MAETSFIRKRARFGSTFQEGLSVITFDATLSENHVHDAIVPDHPIEEGARVNDHVQLLEPDVSLVGTFTNTPIEATPAIRRALNLYDAVLELRRKKTPFTATVGTDSYTDMVIKSVTKPVTLTNGQAVILNIVLKRVNIAQRVTAGVPQALLKPSAQNSGKSQDDKGRQSTKELEGDRRTFALEQAQNLNERILEPAGFGITALR